MIHFVLDTDALTLSQEGQPAVCAQFLQQPPDAVAITVLSVEEQLSGWYTQVRQAKQPDRLAWAYRRLSESIRFLARLEILTRTLPPAHLPRGEMGIAARSSGPTIQS
jgi:tRNA(fMet)-specific endonuclease VapC